MPHNPNSPQLDGTEDPLLEIDSLVMRPPAEKVAITVVWEGRKVVKQVWTDMRPG